MRNPRMTHAEAELLLPWYANNTLKAQERDAVAGHLEQCNECARALALLTRMEAAVNDSGTVPLVPDPQPDKLFEVLDQQSADTGNRPVFKRWQIAAGLAAAAIAAAFVWSVNAVDPTDPAYRTAISADADNEIAYVIELGFAATVSADQRRTILNELGATTVSVAAPDLVTVVIPMPTSSMSDVETWRSTLVGRAEIADARIVAVQLPVRENE